MKIRAMGADLFHVGGLTDTHDECSSRFCQFAPRDWSESIDCSGTQKFQFYKRF